MFDFGSCQIDPRLTDEEPRRWDIGRFGWVYSVSKGGWKRDQSWAFSAVLPFSRQKIWSAQIPGNLGCLLVLLYPGSLQAQPSPGDRLGPGQVDLPGEAPARLPAYPLSPHFLSQPPSSGHNESPASASPDCHSNLLFKGKKKKNFEEENRCALKRVLVTRSVWRFLSS